MTFFRNGEGKVHFAEAAVAALQERRQLCNTAAEAGGIMLGRFIAGSADVVVDEVIGPLSEDKRSRFIFFRPKKQAQRIVDDAWNRSHGTKIYLGEWHTHAEDVPNPSAQDLRNWKRICEEAVFEQDALLFLIAGRTGSRIWEVSKGNTTRELAPVQEQIA